MLPDKDASTVLLQGVVCGASQPWSLRLLEGYHQCREFPAENGMHTSPMPPSFPQLKAALGSTVNAQNSQHPLGKKLSHCCNSSKAAVTYIHEYTHMYMPTFAHVCTHLYLHSCVYTQRYMLIHARIPHTPCGIENCWFPKARSLAKWTSPPQPGCAATVTSLSSQLLIQALSDSKPELHRYMLCLNGSRVFAWMQFLN